MRLPFSLRVQSPVVIALVRLLEHVAALPTVGALLLLHVTLAARECVEQEAFELRQRGLLGR